ncbi:MAG: elongation factor G [Sphaerochaetaceae bacterium]|nr:elongation factor G [Sphaerochaetaceae bacterium]MDC7236440.1 elongation factor G [Sphaerochaetaceae bacterium]MDC7248902.1 elongation factor G [Sphaerochaetaceae bacterium]
MSVTSTDLRNVAIVGHNGTGKTSLMEQMLYCSGVIPKVETIESGKTVSDYTEEEIKKQISIHTSLSHLTWQGKCLNILDTPGYSGFIGEAICGFRATEASIMMVDARDGAQIETIKLWRRLDNRNKPRAVFINKMDRDRANYNNVINDLREHFDATFVPTFIPMGEGEEFKGIINLIEDKAYFFDSNGKEKEGPIPEEFKEHEETFREQLIEYAAEGADDLIEKYFDEGTLTPDDIRRGLSQGLADNRVVPVFCGSTKNASGIVSLLNFIAHNFPSPVGQIEWTTTEDGEHHDMKIVEEGDASAYVFKTTIDQFSGKLSFIKVASGHITPDMELYNPTLKKKEKIGKLYRSVGKKLIETDSLTAGGIGIIAKSNICSTNCTLLQNPSNQKFTFKPLSLPHPIYSLAISTDDKKSADKLNEALHKICEEDLTFQTHFNEETKESVIMGMGDVHLQIILDKISEKQKIKVHTKLPKIAYRETISKKSGIVEYAHKKQSGGHGQYGKVLIEIEPIERGTIYSFTNAIKGGSVSKGYVPGIEKGLKERMEEGYLANYPLVDIGITLVDGKEHPVDSSEMAFKLAAKGALDAALAKANCSLLEPFMNVKVFVENQYLGDILSDLSSKRGRVTGQNEFGQLQEVHAQVPQSEMLNYAIDLKSMTSGTGSFELEFSHYEPLTGRNAEIVINASKTED